MRSTLDRGVEPSVLPLSIGRTMCSTSVREVGPFYCNFHGRTIILPFPWGRTVRSTPFPSVAPCSTVARAVKPSFLPLMLLKNLVPLLPVCENRPCDLCSCSRIVRSPIARVVEPSVLLHSVESGEVDSLRIQLLLSIPERQQTGRGRPVRAGS